MSKLFKLVVIILVVIVAAAGFFIWRNNFLPKPAPNTTTVQTQDSAKNASSSPVSNLKSSILNLKTYTHPDYGFSFDYPGNFGVGNVPDDGGGDTVLIQNPGVGTVAQIYISSFDEPGPITAARIKKDLPQTVITNSASAEIGGQSAFVFDSTADGGQPTREFWFVYGGNLYQITSPKDQSSATEQILSTWKFGQ